MKIVRNYAMIIDIVRIYRKGFDMKQIVKILKFLSLPMALTAAAYLLYINIASLPLSLTLILQYSSYALFLIGMILGIRFNKSKVFFLCTILGISQLLIYNGLSIFSFTQNTLDTNSVGLSVLIPINILLFSTFKERGIFSFWGKLKLGFIVGQFLFIGLILPQNNDPKSLAQYSFIMLDIIDIIQIPQVSILLYLLVFLILCLKLFFKPTLMDSSLVGVIAMTFLAFTMKNDSIAANIFYTMSGLILVIGVVEASYFMAYRDELTGIPARRALKEAMLKLGGKYTIAMVDIDHFKKFNDTYGHDIGDEVLQMVASNLSQVGGGGKAFRFGGEEFTLLFANKNREEVLPQLEELRRSIAKQKHTYKKKRKVNGKDKTVVKQLGVTISIGVAEKNESYRTAEEVLKAADKALYKAKKNGRNCVCK